MQIVWVELEPDYLPNGHLVGFYDRKRGDGELSRIAFIEGYEWIFGDYDEGGHCPKQIIIRCIKPDTLTTPTTLDSFKQLIEDYVRTTNLNSVQSYLGRSRRLQVILDC